MEKKAGIFTLLLKGLGSHVAQNVVTDKIINPKMIEDSVKTMVKGENKVKSIKHGLLHVISPEKAIVEEQIEKLLKKSPAVKKAIQAKIENNDNLFRNSKDEIVSFFKEPEKYMKDKFKDFASEEKMKEFGIDFTKLNPKQRLLLLAKMYNEQAGSNLEKITRGLIKGVNKHVDSIEQIENAKIPEARKRTELGGNVAALFLEPGLALSNLAKYVSARFEPDLIEHPAGKIEEMYNAGNKFVKKIQDLSNNYLILRPIKHEIKVGKNKKLRSHTYKKLNKLIFNPILGDVEFLSNRLGYHYNDVLNRKNISEADIWNSINDEKRKRLFRIASASLLKKLFPKPTKTRQASRQILNDIYGHLDEIFKAQSNPGANLLPYKKN